MATRSSTSLDLNTAKLSSLFDPFTILLLSMAAAAAASDRPHVPESSLHMFKNTARLQCVIPNSPLETSPSFPSSSDMRNSTPEPVLVLAPPSSPTDPNMDHITSLERSLCSDFVCCGGRLPDLHALLEHFEEDHIMVLAPNGKRVYPPEGLRAVPLHPITTSSLHTTPSSSRSSSVLSSPNSASCPLSPAPVYTPFTPSLPIDPAYPYPDSPEIDMPLYDFSQDFYPTYSAPLPTCLFDEDDDDDMAEASVDSHPTSPIPTYVYGLDKGRPISKSRHTLDGALRSISKSNKTKHRHLNPAAHTPNSRRREKAYRCPTPRCTKSYLNPNGLKYHLEKGTCKIESENELEVGGGGDEFNLLLPAAAVPTSPRLSVPQRQSETERRETPPPSGPKYQYQYPSLTRHVYPAQTSAVSSP